MTHTPGHNLDKDTDQPPPTVKCDGCNLETTSPHLLQKSRRSFRAKPLYLCPNCQVNRYRDSQRVLWSLWGFVILLGFFSYWRTGDLMDIVGVFMLVLGLIVISLAATFFHEIAHVLAARLVGWDIHGFVMGIGRVLWEGRWGNTLLQVKIIQMGGATYCTPSAFTPRFQAQAFLVYLAGPLGNLAQVAGYYYLRVWAQHNVESEQLSEFLANIGGLGAIVNGVNCFVNLYPTQFSMGNSMLGSDGHNLLQIVTQPAQFRERYVVGRPLVQFMTLRQLGELEQAGAVIEDAWFAHRRDPYLGLCYSAALVDVDQYERALEVCEAELLSLRESIARSVGIPEQLREQTFTILEAAFKNNQAYAWLRLKINLPEALKLSEETRRVMPWEAAIENTYGYALVLNGRVEEGIAILRAARKRNHSLPAHVRRRISEIIAEAENLRA